MGIKNILDEITAKNFPILKKETVFKYRKQGGYQTNGPKQATPKHNMIKMAKVRENSKSNKRNLIVIYK